MKEGLPIQTLLRGGRGEVVKGREASSCALRPGTQGEKGRAGRGEDSGRGTVKVVVVVEEGELAVITPSQGRGVWRG